MNIITVHNAWVEALGGHNVPLVERRVYTIAKKLEQYQMGNVNEVTSLYSEALESYRAENFQEAFDLLEATYVALNAWIAIHFKPSYQTNLVLASGILMVTQSLIDGSVINIQLRTHAI